MAESLQQATRPPEEDIFEIQAAQGEWVDPSVVQPQEALPAGEPQHNGNGAAASQETAAPAASTEVMNPAVFAERFGKRQNSNGKSHAPAAERQTDAEKAAHAGALERLQQIKDAHEALDASNTAGAEPVPAATDDPAAIVTEAKETEIDPLTAPISEVRKSIHEAEPSKEHETAQIYQETKADQEAAYVPKHAKRTESDNKQREVSEDDVAQLTGEAGVQAMNEMNQIISKAKEEGRDLTDEEQSMLNLVVTAMNTNGLAYEKDARGAVLQNLHETHQNYAQRTDEQQEQAYAEENLADLKGEAGVAAINEMNELLKTGQLLSPEQRTQLSRVRAAMEAFKLHGNVKWNVMERIRGQDDQYKLIDGGETASAAEPAQQEAVTEQPAHDDTAELPAVADEAENADDAVETEPMNLRQRFSDKFKTLVAKFAAKGTNGIAILAENYQENLERRNAYFNDQENGRRRRISAYAAALGAGAVGAALAWANWKGHDTTGVTPNDYVGGGFTGGNGGGESAADITAAAELADQPGEVFTIDSEKSPGFTYTFMDAADKANLNITTEQSYEDVYKPLVAEGYIAENSEHIKGVKVYQMENGDFGFASTGEVEYSHAMMQRMHELMEEAAKKNK